ncbi:MAG: IMP cyclohydrolase [Oscillospiraceae bacterium]
MELLNIAQELQGNSYPGRGIVMGRSEDGDNAVIAYFIMGRSENSRNRIFVESRSGIKTEAFDPAKLVDPSLIIYSPVKVFDNTTIVTNGNQTDTIYDFFEEGRSFEDAIRTRTFEPDFPNFTPRISGVVTGFDYKLSIIKSAEGNPNSVRRQFYEYVSPVPGQGHLIHTYKGDGEPIPAYDGEPKLVEIKGDIDSFTNLLWYNLNSDNKVSLFVRYINVKNGVVQNRIVNKNLSE